MFSSDKVKIKMDFGKIEIILFSQMLDGQRSVLFKMEQLSNEYGAGSRNVKGNVFFRSVYISFCVRYNYRFVLMVYLSFCVFL